MYRYSPHTLLCRWCPPCKVLSPLLERIESDPTLIGASPSSIDLITLNGEMTPKLFQEYRVKLTSSQRFRITGWLTHCFLLDQSCTYSQSILQWKASRRISRCKRFIGFKSMVYNSAAQIASLIAIIGLLSSKNDLHTNISHKNFYQRGWARVCFLLLLLINTRISMHQRKRVSMCHERESDVTKSAGNLKNPQGKKQKATSSRKSS